MTTETLPNGGTFEVTGTRPAKHGMVWVEFEFAIKRIKVEHAILCKDLDEGVERIRKAWGRSYDEVYETAKYEGECRSREKGWK